MCRGASQPPGTALCQGSGFHAPHRSSWTACATETSRGMVSQGPGVCPQGPVDAGVWSRAPPWLARWPPAACWRRRRRPALLSARGAARVPGGGGAATGGMGPGGSRGRVAHACGRSCGSCPSWPRLPWGLAGEWGSTAASRGGRCGKPTQSPTGPGPDLPAGRVGDEASSRTSRGRAGCQHSSSSSAQRAGGSGGTDRIAEVHAERHSQAVQDAPVLRLAVQRLAHRQRLPDAPRGHQHLQLLLQRLQLKHLRRIRTTVDTMAAHSRPWLYCMHMHLGQQLAPRTPHGLVNGRLCAAATTPTV